MENEPSTRRRTPGSLTARRWALLWVALGHLGMAAWVSDPRLTINPDRAILWESWPVHLRVSLWVLSALIVITGACWPRWESVAFGAAMIMPIERAAGHLWSWAHHIMPGHPPGDPIGFGPAVVWASTAALIALVGRSAAGRTPDG